MNAFYFSKKQLFFVFISLIFSYTIKAQVGIGTTSPQATLDITGQPTVTTELDGVIAPRLTGDQLRAKTYTVAQTAAMVYVTAADSAPAGQTIDVTQVGYYYFDGTKWIINTESEDWKITGNAGTLATINFVGTTDNVDLMFRRNNIEAGQIGATNTSLGVNTLLNNTGTNNTALGTDALKTNSSGIENVAIGTNALTANTTAKWNTAVGFNALAANIDNADNTAMGAFALSKNTTGGLDNAAFGAHALQNNTTGLGNAAFGEHALYNNIGGSSNTAVGENSLENNTSGIGNTVIGEDAGTRNTTGHGNVVIGQEALFSSPLGISTGDNNVIIGRYAAQSNTTGYRNVIIGKDGLQKNTAGHDNISIGVAAGTDIDNRGDAVGNTTGDYNVLIGYKAELGGSNRNQATAIGFRAWADCEKCIVLGSKAGKNGAASTVKVGIGNNDPQYRLDVGGDINITGDYRKNGTIIPDYVFETYFDNNNSFNTAYQFESLSSIEKFIKANNHLPNMQSREDIAKNGWNVTENVRVNLEKIEELFLHTIELDKKVTKLQQDNTSLQELVEIQKEQLKKQEQLLNEILEKLQN